MNTDKKKPELDWVRFLAPSAVAATLSLAALEVLVRFAVLPRDFVLTEPLPSYNSPVSTIEIAFGVP